MITLYLTPRELAFVKSHIEWHVALVHDDVADGASPPECAAAIERLSRAIAPTMEIDDDAAIELRDMLDLEVGSLRTPLDYSELINGNWTDTHFLPAPRWAEELLGNVNACIDVKRGYEHIKP